MDVPNCCGKMPSPQKAVLPGLCNLSQQLGISPFAAPLDCDDQPESELAVSPIAPNCWKKLPGPVETLMKMLS